MSSTVLVRSLSDTIGTQLGKPVLCKKIQAHWGNCSTFSVVPQRRKFRWNPIFRLSHQLLLAADDHVTSPPGLVRLTSVTRYDDENVSVTVQFSRKTQFQPSPSILKTKYVFLKQFNNIYSFYLHNFSQLSFSVNLLLVLILVLKYVQCFIITTYCIIVLKINIVFKMHIPTVDLKLLNKSINISRQLWYCSNYFNVLSVYLIFVAVNSKMKFVNQNNLTTPTCYYR